MTNIKKGYANCSGGQIHFHKNEGEGTPIVFLHQTASSGKMFYKVMDRLPNVLGYAFDTPGFGSSFSPSDSSLLDKPSMPQLGKWLTEAINSIGIDEFHIVGHHTGTCIALEIYNLIPDRVKTCTMIGPVPLTEDERNEFRKYYSSPFSPDKNGDYIKTTWDYLAGLGTKSDLELHHREFIDTCRAYLGRAQTYSAVWDQDFVALFEKMECPLLLMAAPDDVLYPYLDRAHKMKPGSIVKPVEGANFEPDHDPDGTVAAIKSFLNI